MLQCGGATGVRCSNHLDSTSQLRGDEEYPAIGAIQHGAPLGVENIMSTTSVMHGAPMASSNAELRHPGMFARAWASIIAGKQAQADEFLRPYLAQASVSDLTELGFTSAEIAKIKKDRHLPVTSWI